MTEKVECKIALALDEEGNWRITKADDDDYTHGYDTADLIDDMAGAVRTVVLTVKINKPVPLQVGVTIPDQPQAAVEVEAKVGETEAA